MVADVKKIIKVKKGRVLMKAKRLIWGIILLIVALGAVCSGLGWIDIGRIGFFKAVATVVCAYGVIQGIWKIRFVELLFSAAFLAIIYDKPLGIEGITPWTVLFAALIASIGLELIFHDRLKNRRRNAEHRCRMKHCQENEKHNGNATYFGESDTTDSGENVYCRVNFGSASKYLNGESFQRAEAEVNFGEAKFYLNQAVPEQDTADVYAHVRFGELQVYVPAQWKVQIYRDNVFCADVREKGRSEFVENAPVINVHANVCFGDVTIQYI